MNHISRLYPKHPSFCNCMNIRRASRAVTEFYDEVLRPSGLTIAQMSLLRRLDEAGTATISELAALLRIDRTTLNRNLKPLTEAGLITVRAGKDSRTRQVAPTEAGRAAAARAWALWGEAQAAMKEYLGEDDLVKLTELLSKLEALAP
jgi:DNA-binding MarR family transcriptional regulator